MAKSEQDPGLPIKVTPASNGEFYPPPPTEIAVEAATGQHPPLPTHLADLLERPERVHRAPNDLAAVKDLVQLSREA